MPRFDLQLVSTTPLSPSVRSLVLRRTDGAPVEFRPGQFVSLLAPSRPELEKRSYSIASAPLGTDSLELAVTRVIGGAFSNLLHELQPGDVLTGLGPEGLFTRAADDPRPALFVGTGTGLAPLRSMAAAALACDARAPLTFLLGFRHEEDILYRAELERWAAEHPHVSVHFTLSQPVDGELSWCGRRGYVQNHLAEIVRAHPSPQDVQVYICGLTKMVTAVKDLARGELALPRRHVHTERFD
jgi:CDP-4-dehydro-6-deoxyglucose reductase, E3